MWSGEYWVLWSNATWVGPIRVKVEAPLRYRLPSLRQQGGTDLLFTNLIQIVINYSLYKCSWHPANFEWNYFLLSNPLFSSAPPEMYAKETFQLSGKTPSSLTFDVPDITPGTIVYNKLLFTINNLFHGICLYNTSWNGLEASPPI